MQVAFDAARDLRHHSGMTQHSELVPIGEAARRVGLSTQTLRRYVDLGELPAVTLPSGRLRFNVVDLDALTTPARVAHRRGGSVAS